MTQNLDTKAAAGDLAKAVQNPVASLISVPVQNLTDFYIGPYQRIRNTVLQFQPVIPVQLGQSWNLITRVIGPVTYQPDITQSHQSGYESLFLCVSCQTRKSDLRCRSHVFASHCDGRFPRHWEVQHGPNCRRIDAARKVDGRCARK